METAIKDGVSNINKVLGGKFRYLKKFFVPSENIPQVENKVDFELENLKEELKKKDLELSYLILNHTQKKQLIDTTCIRLKQLLIHAEDSSYLYVELRGLIVSLVHSEKYEDVKLQQFKIRFSDSHNDFISKVMHLDPKMKESCLLMCTYIKMGKTNKEISELLNITLNTLDKRKSRLRAKFKVPVELTLNDFIMAL